MIWSVYGIQLEKNLDKVAKEKDISKKMKLLLEMKFDFISKNRGPEADRVIMLYDNEMERLKTELLISSSRLQEQRLSYSAFILDLSQYIQNISEEELRSIIEQGRLLYDTKKPVWIGRPVDAWLFDKYFNIKFNSCFSMSTGKKIDEHDAPTCRDGKYILSDKSKKLLQILEKHFPEKIDKKTLLTKKARK